MFSFNFITYADDTTLCGTIAGQIYIENIEKELKRVTEWLKMNTMNKLSLNVKKTKPKPCCFTCHKRKLLYQTYK